MNCPPAVFLCASPQNGDAHWRVVRPMTRLREAGVDTRLCWLGADQMPTEPIAGRVVVLQRVIVGDGDEDAARAWVARLHAAGALAVVADLDDDEVTDAQRRHTEETRPISQADRAALERQHRGHRAMLRAVDGVTVSTEPLAAVVRRYTDKLVIVVENRLDREWFTDRLPEQTAWDGHISIGWAGWMRPDADLAPMTEAWGRIGRRYPDVRFVVGGWQADCIYREIEDLDQIIRIPIQPLDQYPAMMKVDIGCVSVADSPFSRCKSPIKLFEYSMAGAAVVGTDLLYGHCLDDGFRGMVAETVDDWDRCLSWFIESAETRRQLARNLRQHVEATHTLVPNLYRWVDAYQRIIRGDSSVAPSQPCQPRCQLGCR